MSNNIVGYITSDPLYEGFISHQIQNTQIKYFLNLNKKNHLLSWTEYKDFSPMVLNSLLLETFYDGICFYSIQQLFKIEKYELFLDELSKKNIWVGFANEQVFFEHFSGLDQVRNLARLTQIIHQNNFKKEHLWATLKA